MTTEQKSDDMRRLPNGKYANWVGIRPPTHQSCVCCKQATNKETNQIKFNQDTMIYIYIL